MDKEKLLKELEIENISPEEQDEMLKEFNKAVVINLIKKTLEHLSPEEIKKLEEISEEEEMKEDKVRNFLNTRIENYEELSQEALNETLTDVKETIDLLK